MSLSRMAKRRDANEPAIVAALEKVGCKVVRSDVVDLIVGRGKRTWIMEVKTDRGQLTPAQVRNFSDWPGQYNVVRTPEEAVEIVGAGDER